MKRSSICGLAITLVAVAFMAASAAVSLAAAKDAAKAPAADKTPSPAQAPAKVDPNLPRVLIIGDSISIGYTEPVRKALAGKANVFRIPGNGQHTGTGVQKIDSWLGKEKWDVIHFNWGLWDVCHRTADGKEYDTEKVPPMATLPQYEKNLRQLVARLKLTGARLVWATTTPVPDGSRGRIRGDEVKYNAVAEKIMKEQGVATDDLYAAVLPRVGELQLPANVHFTPQGYEFLGGQAAASIVKALEAKGK